MVTCNVFLAFESADKILCCDHLNETSSAVLSLSTICFLIFYSMKLGIFVEFRFWVLLGVRGLTDHTAGFEFTSLRGAYKNMSNASRTRCLQRKEDLYVLKGFTQITMFKLIK